MYAFSIIMDFAQNLSPAVLYFSIFDRYNKYNFGGET